MYSLKNYYSYTLNENLASEKEIIDAVSRKSNNGFHALEIFDGKVVIGKLSSSAMSLWNERDGSGGRGEFSVVYDILKGSGTSTRRTAKQDVQTYIDDQIKKIDSNLVLNRSNSFSYFNFIKYVFDNYTANNTGNDIDYNNVLNCLDANTDLNGIQDSSGSNISITLQESLDLFKEIFTPTNINNSLSNLGSELVYSNSFLDLDQINVYKGKINQNSIKKIRNIINCIKSSSDTKNYSYWKFEVNHGTSESLELDLLFNNTNIRNYKNFLEHLTLEVAINNDASGSSEYKFISNLFTSVTTSGEESKSCDISIKPTLELTPLGNHLKSFTSNESNIKIEVKEVVGSEIFLPKSVGEEDNYPDAYQRPTGIRLGGGSRSSVLSSDLFFCLTVFAISTNLSSGSNLKYIPTQDISNLHKLVRRSTRKSRASDENYFKDLIIMVKRGQISNNYFNDLINIICYDPKGSRKALEVHLENTNFTSESKRAIAVNSINLLYSTLEGAASFASTLILPPELQSDVQKDNLRNRYELVGKYLSNAINNSISSDWFCILKGNKSSEYEKDSSTVGKGHFILIHKSVYSNVLSLGSVQMGGTGYAYVSDRNLENIFRIFFGIDFKGNLDENKSFLNKKLSSLEKKYMYVKNLLSEGGKAGHMMHPYENLHMKISDMKEMISDFQNDFEISEKVDGGNLFFTVNPNTGQILFSRNKKDMTHQETLEKFGPGHGATVLFTDGANSVFNAVKSALSRSDINQIFGQGPEGGKTYINFEIMHPEKVIQIRYDMKYIVLHAIVDFDINGVKVNSSPDDERLLMLIDKLQPYFATQDNEFNLGSNFKVKLNKLSKEDVEELNLELNSITSRLGLTDEMTIADGVKHEIKSLLDQNNLTELLSDEKVEMIYNFITDENSGITGNQIKKDLDKETKKMLSSLGLTSKTKAYKIIKNVTKEFRKLFLLLGVKLLHNVQSRYMSEEAGALNVDELRRLLTAAIEDYDSLVSKSNPTDLEANLINSMSLHVANIRDYGIENAISSPVEGGVFIGKDGNTYKVTGGYGPLNQILGTALYNMDYMPSFKAERKLQGRN